VSEWHEVYANVVAVARYLVEVEDWTAADLLDFLEKPWKWGEKWAEVLKRRES